MTYYGDGNGAVTDLEQNRLDVMPSDTLDGRDVKQLQRTTGVHVYPLARRSGSSTGSSTWPSASPNGCTRTSCRTAPSAPRWPGRSTAPKLVQAALLGYGAPGNTQLSRSYGRFTLDLSNDPKLGYHYDPAKAKRILDQAGWRRRPGRRARQPDGVRARFELAYAGEPSPRSAPCTLIRSWARDVGIEIDVRVYDNDKLDQPRVQQGRRASSRPTSTPSCGRSAAIRRPSSCSRSSPGRRSASGTTRDSRTRCTRTSSSRRCARRPMPRASTPSTSCSASPRRSCRTSSSTRPTTSAQSTRAPGRTGRRSPRRSASRSRRTATTRSSRCARAREATASYPGVGWALAALVALAVLAARLLVPGAAARGARADRDRGRPRVTKLIAQKLALALVTLAFVLTVNFFLFRAVGDPRDDLLRVPHMSPEQRAHLIHARGLDRSQLDQYGIYVRNTLSGQLETSYHSGRPVTDVIGDALPNTLILAIPATILAALLGTWIGIVSARRRGERARRRADRRVADALRHARAVPRDRRRAHLLDLAEGVPEPAGRGAGLDRVRAQPRLGRHAARDAARVRAHGEHPRELEPDHARVALGHARRGLHDDRARDRALTATRRPAARGAQRAAARDRAHGDLARLHRGRRDLHRVGLLVAGHRAAHLRRAAQPRPAGAAGRVPAHVGRGDLLQPARRPAHHRPRPARAAR